MFIPPRWAAVSMSLVVVLGGCLGYAQSRSLPSDRGRIRVAEHRLEDGTSIRVLRTDAGTPLRAGTAWIWSQEPQEQPESYYAAMREAGLNAVRIILFDVWIHEEGYVKYDWRDAAYRRAMFEKLDRAVDFASRHGMYAILNAHNRVPNQGPKYDEKLNTDLWRAVAPRYARRTHVAYELSNEPILGAGKNGVFEDFQTDVLRALARVHAVARRSAPDTHILILTPAGVSGWGHVDAMVNLTRNFERFTGPLDWTKTSVAYHLYHADEKLFPRAENLVALHRVYPGWPSENNFPRRFTTEMLGIRAGDNERSVSFGDEEFVIQTCERLGIGWSHWHLHGQRELEHNFPILRQDAQAKGYWWSPDPPPRAAAGSRR